MSANDDILARLLLIQGAVQECLEMLGGATAVKQQTQAIELPPGTACTHPKDKRTYMMGGYWECLCGVKGHDA